MRKSAHFCRFFALFSLVHFCYISEIPPIPRACGLCYISEKCAILRDFAPFCPSILCYISDKCPFYACFCLFLTPVLVLYFSPSACFMPISPLKTPHNRAIFHQKCAKMRKIGPFLVVFLFHISGIVRILAKKRAFCASFCA